MSEAHLSSIAPAQSQRPLRVRLNDVPALFSEGVTPAPQDSARAWWPHVQAKRLRLRMPGLGLFRRMTKRSTEFLASPQPDVQNETASDNSPHFFSKALL